MAKRRTENTVKIVGKVLKISDLQEVGEKKTLMVDVWVEESEDDLKYPNAFAIQFFKGSAYDISREVKIGDEVRIRATVGGRIYKREKDDEEFLFNKLTGWSCKPADAPELTPSESKSSEKSGAPIEDDDDLPF